MKYSQVYKMIQDEADVNRRKRVPVVRRTKLERRRFLIMGEGNAVADFGELMSHEDKEFVEQVYKKLLNRDPDEAGLAFYLKGYRSSRLTKEDIILQIRYSEEGKQKGISLNHIRPVSFNYKSLMGIEGQEFVQAAYLWILGRDADAKGLSHYVSMLEEEKASKEEILYWICCSEEAKRRSVTIKGLKRRYLLRASLRKFWRIPILGRIGRFIYNLLRVNRRLSAFVRQTNSTLEGQQHQIAGISDNWGRLQHKLDELSEGIELVRQEAVALREQNEKSEQAIGILAEQLEGLREKVDRLCNRKENSYYGIDYFDFENRFRGSREHVKNVQRIYLPYFEGRRRVLDLGCGRGEFTELLLENGIGVTGVDMYAPYVEYMKQLNLPVVLDDAIRYLRVQDRVDGVFLGQVVEHMNIESIIELCQVAHEKLEEGCFLVMETPNPMSLAVFSHAFYMDPSHEKPVHPLTLQYIAEKAGFSRVELLFTPASEMPVTIPALKPEDKDFAAFNEAMRHVSKELYASQDYAVIARK